MTDLGDDPTRRTMPGASRWLKAVVFGVVGLLLFLPISARLGWTYALFGVPSQPWLVNGETGPILRDVLLDPARARFGMVILLGAAVHAALMGGGRRWAAVVCIACWVAVAALVRVRCWSALGLHRHEIAPHSYVALAAMEAVLMVVGSGLLWMLCRSGRLIVGVLASFAVVLGLGYLSRFGRGGAWLIPPFDLPVGFSASLWHDLSRQANALWQPLVAIALIGLGVRERRTAVERAGPVCPRCEYSLRGGSEARCPECGWTVDSAGPSGKVAAATRCVHVDERQPVALATAGMEAGTSACGNASNGEGRGFEEGSGTGCEGGRGA